MMIVNYFYWEKRIKLFLKTFFLQHKAKIVLCQHIFTLDCVDNFL